ncbi:MAG: MATE family efflux transporter [Psychromonas sp.]|nr:MATE family efflux transporter [Psychromonas sp.]
MTFAYEAKKIIKLTTPLFVASFAQVAMEFVDVVMAGGVSPRDMAAVAIAASIWLPSILFGAGILVALIPLISQAHGANDLKSIPNLGQQGIYIALLLSIPVYALLCNASNLLHFMNIDPVILKITTNYFYAIMPAVPAYLVLQALQNYIGGLSITKPSMIIGFLGLLFNVPLNWIFVYGKFGLPALGGAGCGLATAISFWIMALLMLLYTLYTRKLIYFPLFKNFKQPNFKQQWTIFKLGLPIAFTIFFEVLLFAGVAVLVAPLGALVVAAHQSALNFLTMMFMLPASISNAVSIRVGFNIGKKSLLGAKNATFVGFLIGIITTLFTALLTVIFRFQIANMYTDNPMVIKLAGSLLLFAAVFQCIVSVELVAGGALRGYKEMFPIFIRSFLSYWIIGLPLGYILGMTNYIVKALGVEGFWIGLIVGLTVSAALLSQYLFVIQKKHTLAFQI